MTKEQITALTLVYGLACTAPLSSDDTLAKRQKAAKEAIRELLYGKRSN